MVQNPAQVTSVSASTTAGAGIRLPDMHVLFDEAHSEAWSIRPELARAMQPAHPGDASYARAAASLAERDFQVRAHPSGALNHVALEAVDLLVIAHPSDPAWERTTGAGSPRLDPEELAAIES